MPPCGIGVSSQVSGTFITSVHITSATKHKTPIVIMHSTLRIGVFGAFLWCLPHLVLADTITSPDGAIVATVSTSGGSLFYSVTYNGTTVIESSRLGVTVNGTDLGSGASITG